MNTLLNDLNVELRRAAHLCSTGGSKGKHSLQRARTHSSVT